MASDPPKSEPRRPSKRERINAKEFRRKEKQKDSSLRLIVFLLVGGILGGVISYYTVNTVFSTMVGDLQSDNENYQTEFAAMAEDYRSLYDSYEALVQDSKTMQLQITNLHGENEALQENIDQLTELLAIYQANNSQISGDYQTLFQYLQQLKSARKT